MIRCVYARGNRLLHMFRYYSINVTLFYLTIIALPYNVPILWTEYNKTSFRKVRLAINNACGRIFSLSNKAVQVQGMQIIT